MSQAARKNQVVQPEFSDDEIKLRGYAKPNCSKCFGTGKRGIMTHQKGVRIAPTAIVCTSPGCAQDAINKELEEKAAKEKAEKEALLNPDVPA